LVLDASKPEDYIMKVTEESADKAVHVTKALKLFLKTVPRAKEAGNSRYWYYITASQFQA